MITHITKKNNQQNQIQKIDELLVLHELALILNSSHDIDHIILQSATKFNEITQSMGCHILFSKHIRDSLQLETAIHSGPKSFPPGVDETKGISGMTFKTGEIIIVSDAKNDPRVTKKIQEYFGHKSVLAVPINVRGKVIGVIVVYGLEPNHYNEKVGQFLYMLGTHLGLAVENAKLIRELENEAIIDPLTDAYNYRYFIRQLELMAKRDPHQQMALMMMDIDNFKLINDTFGHLIGDLILRSITSLIKGKVRECDVPARYAGDEFAIILPVTCIEQGYEIATMIERAVAEHEFNCEGHQIRMSISWGVACACGKEIMQNINSLIDLADRRLYEMKSLKKTGIKEKNLYT